MRTGLETGAATRQSNEASYEEGCRSRRHLEHGDEHGSHVPGLGVLMFLPVPHQMSPAGSRHIVVQYM